MYVYSRRYFKYVTAFLFVVACAALAYTACTSIFQFQRRFKSLSPAAPGFDAIKSRLESGRIFSFFIYPNTFAGYLILLIPPAFGFVRTERKYRFYF